VNSIIGITRSNRRRASMVTSLALIGLLTLVGCAPADSGPGSSPTAAVTKTSTPAPAAGGVPESAEDAVEDATTALQAYNTTVNQILLEGGVNPERIDAYASGTVRDEIVATAAQVADLGYRFEGGITARVESAYAGEAQVGDETLEFGSVHITFCNDSSARTAVLPDGTDAPVTADQAPRYEAGVLFDPAQDSWFVRSLTPLGTSCA
jgi:hypothetical protein